ncbi:PQQ-binding-like beta-propeller repeat protein [Streptosporangium canum]|uniref:PQQ-binding-like beta-propeller repeat protein n=1 Tax=Streptosporangium canum TaxID=324952 RepID=UPI00344AD734
MALPSRRPDLRRPLATGGAVYVGGGGVLHKLDAATGTRRWGFQTGGDIGTAPVVAGGCTSAA